MRPNLLIVKVVLRTAALVEIGFFTVTHWFFREYFFNSLGIKSSEFSSTFVISQLQLIGALVLGFAILSWIAASDPIKYRTVIQVMLLTGSLCVSIFVYSVATGKLPEQFAFNATLIALQLLLVTVFYPWKKGSGG